MVDVTGSANDRVGHGRWHRGELIAAERNWKNGRPRWACDARPLPRPQGRLSHRCPQASLWRRGSIETSVLRARFWFGLKVEGVALIVEPHPQRQSQVSQDRFDLIQRLAAEVLDLQQ